MNITEPLRLSVGSHIAGSGRGCAMNVISWENGDTTITDFPKCADLLLASVVQEVNDHICQHSNKELLCPECSMLVLELAHRTVGTRLVETSEEMDARAILIAVEQIEPHLHLGKHRAQIGACALIRRYLAAKSDPSGDFRRELPLVSSQFYLARKREFTDPITKAVEYTLDATIEHMTGRGPEGIGSLSRVRTALNHICEISGDYHAWGDRIIDTFEKITGMHSTPVPKEVTVSAINAMCGRS